jgi:leucyl-tRNA synthetase
MPPAAPPPPRSKRGEAGLRHRHLRPSSIHPFEARGIHLPVYVANFVLMEYGTGAIFGCPAHDQRDLDFARKYGLPVPASWSPPATSRRPTATRPIPGRAPAGQFGLPRRHGVDAAKAAVIARAEAEGWGKGTTVWRLRDWGVSRQRYWGTPIPFIHCDAAAWCRCPRPAAGRAARGRRASTPRQPAGCATRPGSMSIAPAAASPARRETDTLDTFVDSAWYFLRFASQPATSRSTPWRAKLAAGRAVYRRDRACDPAPALRPLLDPRAELSARSTSRSRSPACSRRAW